MPRPMMSSEDENRESNASLEPLEDVEASLEQAA